MYCESVEALEVWFPQEVTQEEGTTTAVTILELLHVHRQRAAVEPTEASGWPATATSAKASRRVSGGDAIRQPVDTQMVSQSARICQTGYC